MEGTCQYLFLYNSFNSSFNFIIYMYFKTNFKVMKNSGTKYEIVMNAQEVDIKIMEVICENRIA